MGSGGAHRCGEGQSKQTRRSPPAFREAEALFSAAENRIDLLRRVRPANGPATLSIWVEALRRGERRTLHWSYAPPPDLTELRSALGRAASELGGVGPIGELYAARAAELELEARLAESVGSPGFARLARERHAPGSSPEWSAARERARSWASAAVSPPPEPLHAARAAELELEARLAESVGSPGFARLARERHAPGSSPEWSAARERARSWASAAVSPPPEPLHASEDAACPSSLVSVLAAEIGRRRLPLRLELSHDLASCAACGDGVIFVRAGERLSLGEAQRISAHELLGHALPRLAARAHPLGLLRVGSARSSDDEEGRALHIEEELGALDDRRQRELGLRHLAALAVADGAGAEECVAELGRFGCSLELGARLYARVARGGGLCRELTYMPAWLRFRAVAGADPELAAWLSRGRLSVAAARVLRAEGVAGTGNASAFLGLSR